MSFKVLGITCILFYLTGCQKSDKFQAVEVWGHGGAVFYAQGEYPDNTLESAIKSWEFYQLEGIELDVQISKNGTPWLFHDQRLEERTNGKGCIYTNTDNYLENLQYFNRPQQHIKLAKLVDVLNAAPTNFNIMIDLRLYDFCAEKTFDHDTLLMNLEEVIGQYPHLNFYLASFNASLLSKAAQYSWDFLFIEYSTFEEAYPDILSHNVDGLIIRNKEINADQAEIIKQNDLQLMIFEVRSRQGFKQAAAKSPTMILSDEVKRQK